MLALIHRSITERASDRLHNDVHFSTFFFPAVCATPVKWYCSRGFGLRSVVRAVVLDSYEWSNTVWLFAEQMYLFFLPFFLHWRSFTFFVCLLALRRWTNWTTFFLFPLLLRFLLSLGPSLSRFVYFWHILFLDSLARQWRCFFAFPSFSLQPFFKRKDMS